MSRTSFFRKIGAEFANTRWSWCAVHHDKREVYFGIWNTQSTGASGIVLSEDWETLRGRRQPGYSDAKSKLRLVEEDKYRLLVFQMIQGQENFLNGPSIIKSIDETLVTAKLEKIGSEWKAIFYDAEDEPAEVLTKNNLKFFPEGAKKQVFINSYERNGAARKACIDHYGATCQVCEFDFGAVYGTLGEGFIHVHHINPIAAIKKAYSVDPIEDLVPLCPNCHAMVHRSDPPTSIDDLRELITRVSKQ